jgi:hypothetical protein
MTGKVLKGVVRSSPGKEFLCMKFVANRNLVLVPEVRAPLAQPLEDVVPPIARDAQSAEYIRRTI